MPRYLLITLILLFAAGWLSQDMAELATWKDEAWTMTVSQQDNLSAVLDFVQGDVHPPLYFVLGYGWQNIVGNSFFMLRLPGLMA
jgi:uncharacterized membrane protein